MSEGNAISTPVFGSPGKAPGMHASSLGMQSGKLPSAAKQPPASPMKTPQLPQAPRPQVPRPTPPGRPTGPYQPKGPTTPRQPVEAPKPLNANQMAAIESVKKLRAQGYDAMFPDYAPKGMASSAPVAGQRAGLQPVQGNGPPAPVEAPRPTPRAPVEARRPRTPAPQPGPQYDVPFSQPATPPQPQVAFGAGPSPANAKPYVPYQPKPDHVIAQDIERRMADRRAGAQAIEGAFEAPPTIARGFANGWGRGEANTGAGIRGLVNAPIALGLSGLSRFGAEHARLFNGQDSPIAAGLDAAGDSFQETVMPGLRDTARMYSPSRSWQPGMGEMDKLVDQRANALAADPEFGQSTADMVRGGNTVAGMASGIGASLVGPGKLKAVAAAPRMARLGISGLEQGMSFIPGMFNSAPSTQEEQAFAAADPLFGDSGPTPPKPVASSAPAGLHPATI